MTPWQHWWRYTVVTRIEAVVVHLRLVWHGCNWCGRHHGWGGGALLLHEDSAINSRILSLLPIGYYHLRCWNLTKWFDLVEVRDG